MANILVLVRDDPAALDQLERRVIQMGEFDEIVTSERHLIAVRHLPGERCPIATQADGHIAWADGAELAHRGGVEHAAVSSPRQLGHQSGDFSLVAARPDSVTIVRSVSGAVPWWYTADERGNLTATTQNRIFGLLGDFEPDPFVHLAACDGITYPDRSGPYSGTRALPRGTALVVGGSGATEVTY